MSEFDVKGLTIYFNDDDKPLDCTSSGKTEGCPLNPGAIAGIVIGAVAFVAIIIGISVYCYKKHQTKNSLTLTPSSESGKISIDDKHHTQASQSSSKYLDNNDKI
jgi:hypothetical protein